MSKDPDSFRQCEPSSAHKNVIYVVAMRREVLFADGQTKFRGKACTGTLSGVGIVVR